MEHDIATAPVGETSAVQGRWCSFALYAGGATRLDGVVEHAVGPAVRAARPRRWGFVRWVGKRGPHVRVAFEGITAGDELRDILAAGIERACSAPERGSLLALPASWRGGEHVGFELVEVGPSDEPRDPLDEVSSAIALSALPRLPDGKARAAHALDLLAASAGAIDAEGFWDEVARRWTGSDDRGIHLRDLLAARADAIGAELLDRARELRADAQLADGLERYAEACAVLRTGDAARHHAHMTANRLGVTPLEEALLALVLARPASTLSGNTAATRAASAAGDTSATRAPAAAGDAAAARDASATRETSATRASAPPPREPALVLDEVSANGGPPSAASLTVRRGETVALLGPAGSGKSALLEIAAGLRRPSRGAAGATSSGDATATGGRLAVGLPDDELVAESTARENLDLRLRTEGVPAGADALLEQAGLTLQAGTPAADLDAGERRRLAIASALAGDPAVLLLDEPTAGLSAVQREAVWALLGRRREAGGATLLTTSSLQEAQAVADRAALVREGALVTVASPDELASEHFEDASLHVRVGEEPDRALLEDLPEVSGVRIEERVDHWVIELQTRQPEELRELLRADPEIPEIIDAPA